MNFFSKTEHEKLQAQKESFKKLMPFLRGLDYGEQRTLIHLLRNKDRARAEFGREFDEDIYDELTSGDLEKELARISEEENHALKNRYRHNRQTMDFAEKERMPVDETKVRDMLRNQHIFRNRMNVEIGTY